MSVLSVFFGFDWLVVLQPRGNMKLAQVPLNRVIFLIASAGGKYVTGSVGGHPINFGVGVERFGVQPQAQKAWGRLSHRGYSGL